MELELKDQLAKATGAVREIGEKLDAEQKARGEASAETKAAFDRVNEHIEEIERKFARLDLVGREQKDDPQAAVKASIKELVSWYRTGEVKGKPGVEVKALTVADDTSAGVFAQPEMRREILKGVVEYSPIRSVANVVTTNQNSVLWPKRTGSLTPAAVGEVDTRSETTGITVGKEEITAHEMYAIVDASNWMLEDSAFDLEAFIASEVSEQMGVVEGRWFISGSGTAQAEGIVTNSAVPTQSLGGSNAITADGMFDLVYKPKTGYTTDAVLAINRTSIKALRKLKDSQNRYLWEPGLNGQRQSTILGYPVLECPDLDSEGASKKPAIFGSFRRGYTVVDRLGMTVLRDPFSQSSSGKVRFTFRRRVGGQVTIAEALVIGTT